MVKQTHLVCFCILEIDVSKGDVFHNGMRAVVVARRIFAPAVSVRIVYNYAMLVL